MSHYIIDVYSTPSTFFVRALLLRRKDKTQNSKLSLYTAGVGAGGAVEDIIVK